MCQGELVPKGGLLFSELKEGRNRGRGVRVGLGGEKGRVCNQVVR